MAQTRSSSTASIVSIWTRCEVPVPDTGQPLAELLFDSMTTAVLVGVHIKSMFIEVFINGMRTGTSKQASKIRFAAGW
jgi:hypothetical protein